MKKRLAYWLISVANKLLSGEYYDFGSEIVGLQTMNNHVIVATKYAVFESENLAERKWHRLQVKKENSSHAETE